MSHRTVVLCSTYRDGEMLARDLGLDMARTIIASAASATSHERLRGLSDVTFIEAPGYWRNSRSDHAADLMQTAGAVMATGARIFRAS